MHGKGYAHGHKIVDKAGLILLLPLQDGLVLLRRVARGMPVFPEAPDDAICVCLCVCACVCVSVCVRVCVCVC